MKSKEKLCLGSINGWSNAQKLRTIFFNYSGFDVELISISAVDTEFKYAAWINPNRKLSEVAQAKLLGFFEGICLTLHSLS